MLTVPEKSCFGLSIFVNNRIHDSVTELAIVDVNCSDGSWLRGAGVGFFENFHIHLITGIKFSHIAQGTEYVVESAFTGVVVTVKFQTEICDIVKS